MSERTGNALQEHLDAIEKVVGNARAFHHHAHEHKRRDRDENEVFRSTTPDARKEIEELDQPEGVHSVADKAKQ